MRVLYIEDNEMNRLVVRQMLTAVGVEVLEAENGQVGVEWVEADDAVDLILLDLRMPVMDGFTALQRIRGRGDPKGRTPIVVMTADAAPGLRDTCIGLGADDFLAKPIQMDALFDAIGRVSAAQETAMALA